ncbi:7 transmembrane receptor (rhodopsin family) domain-containing protein [Ditylenchus destructor]|nr:7 transmembrane receptor (rhodopsin family) domain-containing protein [Ditylenchus destructor]
MNCSGAVAPNLEFTSATLSIVVCYLLVFLLAFIGNSVMFLILFRNQCVKRRRVHSLLLHMTVAHLLVTLIYMPKEIIHNITVAWWGGDLLCRICKFFDVFGVALSAGILMCLSLDRFYSILFPLYVINAKKSVMRMLSVAWTVSLISSLPQIYIFRTARHPCFSWYTQCVSADVIGLVSPKLTFWFSVLNILQVYFIPLIVILVCYGSILISISLKTRTVNGHLPASSWNKAVASYNNKNKAPSSLIINNGYVDSSGCCKVAKSGGYGTGVGNCDSGGTSLRRTGGQDSFQRAKNRTLKMTIVLVLAFLLCWTPYTVAMFIHFFHASSSHRPIPPLLSKFLYAFAVFNSALSPYLYGYFSFNIREELKLLLYCCSKPSCFSSGGSSSAYSSQSASSLKDRRRMAVRQRPELSSSTMIGTTILVNTHNCGPLLPATKNLAKNKLLCKQTTVCTSGAYLSPQPASIISARRSSLSKSNKPRGVLTFQLDGEPITANGNVAERRLSSETKTDGTKALFDSTKANGHTSSQLLEISSPLEKGIRQNQHRASLILLTDDDAECSDVSSGGAPVATQNNSNHPGEDLEEGTSSKKPLLDTAKSVGYRKALSCKWRQFRRQTEPAAARKRQSHPKRSLQANLAKSLI